MPTIKKTNGIRGNQANFQKILVAVAREPAGYFTPPPGLLEAFGARVAPREVVFARDAGEVEDLSGVGAVLAWQFPEEALRRAPDLRLLMYAADGLGPKRLYPALVDAAVEVCNSRGVRAPAMAEHAAGMLLALSRRLPEARDAQRASRWAKDDFATGRVPGELEGRPVVLLGAGEIGARVGRILGPGLGCTLRVVRARPSLGSAGLLAAVFGIDQRREALQGAAAVIASLPPTEAAHGLLGPEEFACMAPGSFVVNVGRGGTVDETALLAALDAGPLAGAALDVFGEEPLPASSPLWTRPDVLLSPHCAGHTPSLWPRLLDLFAENIAALDAGRPLRTPVHKTLGY